MSKAEPIFRICRRDYAHREHNVQNSDARIMKGPVNSLTQLRLLAFTWQHNLLNETYQTRTVKYMGQQLFSHS